MKQRYPKDTNQEVETNANDIRNNIIEDNDITLISSQTGIKDEVLIKRVLCECENDIAGSIIKLLDIQYRVDDRSNEVREPTVFDQIRGILDEKDRIFHDVMKPKPTSPTVT